MPEPHEAVWQAGSSLRRGITPTDPLTLIVVLLLLIAVTVAACCFPARCMKPTRRAMKINPIVASQQQ